MMAWLLGCGAGGHPYVYQSPTTEALQAFSQRGPRGAEMPLSDATAFEWDQVHYFSEGARHDQIEQALDQPLFGGRTGRVGEPGPLLVFVREREVVEAIAVIPPLFLSANASIHASATAIVVAHSKPPAPHLLLLRSKDQP